MNPPSAFTPFLVGIYRRYHYTELIKCLIFWIKKGPTRDRNLWWGGRPRLWHYSYNWILVPWRVIIRQQSSSSSNPASASTPIAKPPVPTIEATFITLPRKLNSPIHLPPPIWNFYSIWMWNRIFLIARHKGPPCVPIHTEPYRCGRPQIQGVPLNILIS